jgi:uncharacterized protein (TIGR02246 family)
MTDEPDGTPTDVVDSHLEAYNDRDAAAFADHFAEDAVVARQRDGTVVASGRDEIREHYAELFEAVPDLHCTFTDTLTLGSFVVCAERVTGTPEPMEALALYEVQDGRIQRLWLAE